MHCKSYQFNDPKKYSSIGKYNHNNRSVSRNAELTRTINSEDFLYLYMYMYVHISV